MSAGLRTLWVTLELINGKIILVMLSVEITEIYFSTFFCQNFRESNVFTKEVARVDFTSYFAL